MTPIPPTRSEIAATTPSRTVRVWLDSVAVEMIDVGLKTL